jgi:hypothetical protein
VSGRYTVRRSAGAWRVRNPEGVVVLSSRNFGSAVWLANHFAKRRRVHVMMRSYGEGARFADADH